MPTSNPDLTDELATLRAWKESALLVESEWDAQAVGTALGVPLGRSIRAAILPGIEALRAENARLRAALGEMMIVYAGIGIGADWEIAPENRRALLAAAELARAALVEPSHAE